MPPSSQMVFLPLSSIYRPSVDRCCLPADRCRAPGKKYHHYFGYTAPRLIGVVLRCQVPAASDTCCAPASLPPLIFDIPTAPQLMSTSSQLEGAATPLKGADLQLIHAALKLMGVAHPLAGTVPYLRYTAPRVIASSRLRLVGTAFHREEPPLNRRMPSST